MSRLHTLSNGVRVVCDAAAGYETLALTVAAGRGARSEPKNRSGWSHLLEHMVFKGAGERSARDIVEVIEAEGASINAHTGYERTSFQVRALRGGLELGLTVIGDLMLRPTLDPGELAKEKLVVGQEIAEAADTPDDLVFELAQEQAFGDHPLGRPVLGTVKSLKPSDPKSLEAWRAALYAPDRLVVAAAGAVDETELLRLAESVFGAEAPSGAPIPDAGTFAGGVVATAKRLEQAHLVFLLPAPGVTDEDHFALRVLTEALGGGMSSRLFQEARENLGLAYAIDAYADTYQETGLLGVYAGCTGGDAKRLAEVTAVEIVKVSQGALTASELARCKAQLKASIFMGRESLAGRAEQAAAQVLVFGRLMAPDEQAARIDAVTGEQIGLLMQRILTPQKSAIATLGSAKAGAAAEAFHRGLFG